MKIRNITLGILTLFLSSCASMMHGPNQTVEFRSQPSGAKITIDGKDYGKTPQSISLKRKGREKGDEPGKQMYDVSIALDGYYPHEFKIKREMDTWFLGNLIFGGLIGIIVDASSGSMYKLTPNQINVQINKDVAEAVETNDDRVYIAVSMKVDPNWEKIGQLERVK